MRIVHVARVFGLSTNVALSVVFLTALLTVRPPQDIFAALPRPTHLSQQKADDPKLDHTAIGTSQKSAPKKPRSDRKS